MTIFGTVGLCMVGVAAVLVLKEVKKNSVPLVVLALGVTVLLASLPWLAETVGFLKKLADYSDTAVTGTVVRALGVAYLSSTAAVLCRSSGEETVGSYVETAGKLCILSLTVPLLSELFTLALL